MYKPYTNVQSIIFMVARCEDTWMELVTAQDKSHHKYKDCAALGCLLFRLFIQILFLIYGLNDLSQHESKTMTSWKSSCLAEGL